MEAPAFLRRSFGNRQSDYQPDRYCRPPLESERLVETKRKGCSHGKTFEEPCARCELVTLEWSIPYHRRALEKDLARKVVLEQQITEKVA